MIAVIIMLVSAISGAGIVYMNANGNYNIISKELSTHPAKNSTNDNIGISAVDLFIHNITADLIVIVGGVFFQLFQ